MGCTSSRSAENAIDRPRNNPEEGDSNSEHSWIQTFSPSTAQSTRGYIRASSVRRTRAGLTRTRGYARGLAYNRSSRSEDNDGVRDGEPHLEDTNLYFDSPFHSNSRYQSRSQLLPVTSQTRHSRHSSHLQPISSANANSSANSISSNSSSRNLEDLEQLQLDLATMEHLFQSLLTHAYARISTDSIDASAHSTVPNNGGCPPANSKAIKMLPTITITAEDLTEESNRECCICFFNHSLKDKVARLPCGHLFHRPCISEWLQKRCTCPICRWELPTDDVIFEGGRLDRMKSRQMRLKLHDLHRMTLGELEDLVVTRCNNSECGNIISKKERKNRKELIERIKKSEKIDIIDVSASIPSATSPKSDVLEGNDTAASTTTAVSSKDLQSPLLEYTTQELRDMNVNTIKMILNDCDVEWKENADSSKEWQKEDLIQLLTQSGKVLIKNKSMGDTDKCCVNYSCNISPTRCEEEKEELGNDGLHN